RRRTGCRPAAAGAVPGCDRRAGGAGPRLRPAVRPRPLVPARRWPRGAADRAPVLAAAPARGGTPRSLERLHRRPSPAAQRPSATLVGPLDRRETHMGLLVDGRWQDKWYETSESGEFRREE